MSDTKKNSEIDAYERTAREKGAFDPGTMPGFTPDIDLGNGEVHASPHEPPQADREPAHLREASPISFITARGRAPFQNLPQAEPSTSGNTQISNITFDAAHEREAE